jgi:hypothetical protein
LNLSANYFGDIKKEETGKTAQEYIQSKVIEVAYELERNIHSILAVCLNNWMANLPMNTDHLINQGSELRKSSLT